jgi:hypothetical protein
MRRMQTKSLATKLSVRIAPVSRTLLAYATLIPDSLVLAVVTRLVMKTAFINFHPRHACARKVHCP